MRIDVVTLFPELFDAPLRTGVIGRAVQSARPFSGHRESTMPDPSTRWA